MPEQALTPTQRAMVDTWEAHMAAEFDTRSIDATMATMTSGPTSSSSTTPARVSWSGPRLG